jgi:hypothetical protein
MRVHHRRVVVWRVLSHGRGARSTYEMGRTRRRVPIVQGIRSWWVVVIGWVMLWRIGMGRETSIWRKESCSVHARRAFFRVCRRDHWFSARRGFLGFLVQSGHLIFASALLDSLFLMRRLCMPFQLPQKSLLERFTVNSHCLTITNFFCWRRVVVSVSQICGLLHFGSSVLTIYLGLRCSSPDPNRRRY